MPRQPLPLGTWGRITRSEVEPGRFRARAKYRDLDGVTRRFERFGPTGAKAETALTTYLRDRRRQSGGDTLTPDSKVSDLLDDWLRNADDGSRRPQTLTDYRSAVDGHIKPGIGQVRIREATVGTIDRFLRGIKGDGIRKRTRTVLSLAFGYAARLDLVAANPVRDTTTVRKRSNGVEVPKLADVHRYRDRKSVV